MRLPCRPAPSPSPPPASTAARAPRLYPRLPRPARLCPRRPLRHACRLTRRTCGAADRRAILAGVHGLAVRCPPPPHTHAHALVLLPPPSPPRRRPCPAPCAAGERASPPVRRGMRRSAARRQRVGGGPCLACCPVHGTGLLRGMVPSRMRSWCTPPAARPAVSPRCAAPPAAPRRRPAPSASSSSSSPLARPAAPARPDPVPSSLRRRRPGR
jgi:hypothetical protein